MLLVVQSTVLYCTYVRTRTRNKKAWNSNNGAFFLPFLFCFICWLLLLILVGEGGEGGWRVVCCMHTHTPRRVTSRPLSSHCRAVHYWFIPFISFVRWSTHAHRLTNAHRKTWRVQDHPVATFTSTTYKYLLHFLLIRTSSGVFVI